MKIPLSYCRRVNQELCELKILRDRNLLLIQIIMEVVIEQLLPKIGVKWTTIRDESTCFCNITYESLLQRFEFISVLNPPVFVVLE